MTRGSFLKAISIMIASPKVIGSVKFKTPKEYLCKRCCFFKITPELQKDKESLEFTIKEQAQLNGIDIKKDFNIEIGFLNNDISNKLLTCIITQYERTSPI